MRCDTAMCNRCDIDYLHAIMWVGLDTVYEHVFFSAHRRARITAMAVLLVVTVARMCVSYESNTRGLELYNMCRSKRCRPLVGVDNVQYEVVNVESRKLGRRND